MKPAAFLFCALAVLSALPSRGQTASTPVPTLPSVDPNDPNAAPAGATVITSDELHMDQAGHIAVFTNNVVVVGTNFNMKCQEMTVYFTKDSKINEIISKGDVVILQPGRITHCGQAHYFRDEDKFILTESSSAYPEPDILDNKNEIQAPQITIYRTKQTLETKGRTKTLIRQGIGSSTNSAPTTPPQQ